MTVGVLLQQLKTSTDEEFMNKYFAIIIDEVHARAVDNDLVMYYLKKLIQSLRPIYRQVSRSFIMVKILMALFIFMAVLMKTIHKRKLKI